MYIMSYPSIMYKNLRETKKKIYMFHGSDAFASLRNLESSIRILHCS